MGEIKFDKRNYRKHNAENKRLIKKSLKECGAGRSVLLDADDSLIAGNGVYEQAKALGIPVRVIETDGTELIAVKRTDLSEDDEKRRLLALADNATSDTSEWDVEAITADLSAITLAEWDIKLPEAEEEKEFDPDLPDCSKDLQEETFRVEVVCEDENMQQELYNKLVEEGYECRLLTL